MKKMPSAALAVLALFTLNFSQSNAASNIYLPIVSITPGATDPNVIQANIGSTICVSGYTATVRPASSYTTSLKISQLRGSYSRYADLKTGDFEEDHLISLEIGGSPSSPMNLWPEPYKGSYGARIKDQLENKLHSLVCSDQLPLKTAQSAVATNWIAAYSKYVSASISTPVPPVETPPSTVPVIKTSAPSASPTPSGATGRCNDGTFSFAASHRGMCSRHGGVAQYLS
jgi:Protein of unknown function (DUF3761)